MPVPHHLCAVELGGRRYDITTRALVMGILNRTPDSFFDKGATWDWDAFWARADKIVNEGADILDVGAVKAGPGAEVSEDEEWTRLMPAVEGLVARFDLPVSVDTWRASVAARGVPAGRRHRQRHQRLRRPRITSRWPRQPGPA